MQPLNPFLSGFFKSTLPAQCTPIHHHILLVPTTEVLLTSRDRDSGALYADLAGSEEFLASHVLRCPIKNASGPGGKDVSNMRENRGKAKQYTTVNGKTVVIKDAYVYSNKGFKNLNQAQILADIVWYSDTLEPRQWLVYYISRPLFGIYEELKIVPARLSDGLPDLAPPSPASPMSPNDIASPNGVPPKKEVHTFIHLLNNFPMIARQMQPGLERLFKEFHTVFTKPLPPPPSASVIPDPAPDGPIVTAIRKARSNSVNSASQITNGHIKKRQTDELYTEDDEEIMRGALETAVTAAIDLFQMVDKQQLSMLGATTDLTGPLVERLIERYVSEQVHDTILYPRLCSLRRLEDLDLESKIRQMEYVDISQVGIVIHGGRPGKHEMTLRLGRAVHEFRKLGVAGSPQQMMDILLITLKTVTKLTETPTNTAENGSMPSEKTSQMLAINADTLVSLLLIVVIRSQVRHLQARLLYMRHFMFIDDVESGEMGYALSTLEAVLSYLVRDSGGLRKASRRNNNLWQATKTGNVKEMTRILEPNKFLISYEDDTQGDWTSHEDGDTDDAPWNAANGHTRQSLHSSSRLSQASTLNHVFPFLIQHHGNTDHDRVPPLRKPKTVTMDTRSLSSSSETSLRSHATTIDSTGSGIEGDTSIERLSQTEDSSGESVPMMAIQYEQPKSLGYLLRYKTTFH